MISRFKGHSKNKNEILIQFILKSRHETSNYKIFTENQLNKDCDKFLNKGF